MKVSLVKLGSRFGSIADEIIGLQISITLMRISAFDFDADPDPAFLQSDGNLRPRRPDRAPF